MSGLDNFDNLFIVWAFLFQVILIIHFSIRKKYFESYTQRFGWLVYALSIPAVLISILFIINGKSWSFWLGGFLFLIFAIFGYWVEYVKKINWRTPIQWPIFIPYIILYLATIMFYWWPLALLYQPLWYVYAILFIIATYLNIRSH